MNLTDSVDTVLRGKRNQRILAVRPDQSVYDAIEKMATENVGALLVLSGETLVGIISERDYARKVILKGRSSRDTLVSEVMTNPVVYVDAESKVYECMAVMSTQHIRHLPVKDGARVVGVVSIGDLVGWIISSQAQTIDDLEGYIAGRYPG